MATTHRKGHSSDCLADRAPRIIYSVTYYNRINIYSLASFCHISINIIYLFIYLSYRKVFLYDKYVLIGSQINKLKCISVPEKGYEGLNGLRTTTKSSLFVIIFNMVIAMISDCHLLSCMQQT